MYYSQRKMVLETFNTMLQALEEAKKKPQYAQQLGFDCIQGIIQADDFLTETCPTYRSDKLQKVVDCLEQIEVNTKCAIQQASISLHNCKTYISTLPVRYKMVFMPYIASMWTALESIWAAAAADQDCDAYVVPIPYWNLKLLPDGTVEKTTLVYEGGEFPDYVPVIDYQRFDVEVEHPDAIYIHNPYDECNTLTRIPEEFYSGNLKKHTEKLIYSPYYIQYAVAKNQRVSVFPCYQNMDYILLQSKKLGDAYIKSGVDAKKILLLGSPKTDHIISPIQSPKIPDEWLEKAQGKKVILLNTHMQYLMLQRQLSDTEEPILQGFICISNFIDEILSDSRCLLLWRPHPLLVTMLKSRGMSWLSSQTALLMEKVQFSENGILDLSNDYSSAFALSDALITLGGSSMLSEYLLTKKPVTDGNLDRNSEYITSTTKTSPFNCQLIYYEFDFMKKEDFEAALLPFSTDTLAYFRQRIKLLREHFIRGFVAMVCNGEDPMKEARLKGVENAFINMDGTCGQKVHNKIKAMLA